MTKADFKKQVAEMIEEALMRQSGIGDWLPQPSPEEIADDVADLAQRVSWFVADE